MSATFMIPSRIADKIGEQIADGQTGGTFSVDGHAVPTDGYFVGGVVPSLINPTVRQLTEFVEIAGADYVGYWADEQDGGKIYVDAVDWTPSRAYAERLADLRGEIAFWDVAKGQEIRVREEYAGYDR